MPIVLTFFKMLILAPLVEEYVFRESLIGWVGKTNKALILTMSLISVILFALFHVIKVPEFIYYLPLSLGFTYVYLENDGNVSSSILMHSIANGLAFFLMSSGAL